MKVEPEAIRIAIRTKVRELGATLGNDASALSDDDLIPATGFLDSAAILELVVWYENEFDMPLQQEEINIDNFGSVNAMVSFLIARTSV
jgi:D-alanine--poly(phosphoribitol) ligase subunit 2